MIAFIKGLLYALVSFLIGWIVYDKVPTWLSVKGTLATIIKVIGIWFMICAVAGFILSLFK